MQGWNPFNQHLDQEDWDAYDQSTTALESKRCPLCGAASPSDVSECFVCGWHGAFEKVPAPVDIHVGEDCAELEEAIQRFEWKQLSRSERFWAMMRRLMSH